VPPPDRWRPKPEETFMFKGSFPALVTPFKNGDVDTDALKDLVEWHIAEGSAGIVPVGRPAKARR
jgi:dihydrodipicolinate synthase/N-acetylneuraminate lyase